MLKHWNLRRRTNGAHGREAGQALLLVLIAVVLLGTIPVALATNVFDQLPQTTRNLNYEGAYEAAQGGLNDYLQLLDGNESYGLYCSTCANGNAGNAAFSSWVQLSTSPPEYYTYAPTDLNGLITLQVSGKAGTNATAIVRTFKYTIKPATSLSDVYWSNYETIDPGLGSSYHILLDPLRRALVRQLHQLVQCRHPSVRPTLGVPGGVHHRGRAQRSRLLQ